MRAYKGDSEEDGCEWGYGEARPDSAQRTVGDTDGWMWVRTRKMHDAY